MATLEELKNYIGNDGCVAFEHGVRRPSFSFEGYKYIVNMIDSKVVYCYKKIPFVRGRGANLPLSRLPQQTINKLFNAVKKYEEYCKNEA